jgi:hypothetical protein
MLISKDVNAYQFLNDRLWRKAVIQFGTSDKEVLRQRYENEGNSQ